MEGMVRPHEGWLELFRLERLEQLGVNGCRFEIYQLLFAYFQHLWLTQRINSVDW